MHFILKYSSLRSNPFWIVWNFRSWRNIFFIFVFYNLLKGFDLLYVVSNTDKTAWRWYNDNEHEADVMLCLSSVNIFLGWNFFSVTIFERLCVMFHQSSNQFIIKHYLNLIMVMLCDKVCVTLFVYISSHFIRQHSSVVEPLIIRVY